MKILYAASEATPFAKSGGLADVAGSLPKALVKDGVDARVIMPLYGDLKFRDRLEYVTNYSVPVGWRSQYCGLFKAEVNGVTYYFLDNEYYFKRRGLYGFYDDGWIDERAQVQVMAGSTGEINLTFHYPRDLTEDQWLTVYVNGEAREYINFDTNTKEVKQQITNAINFKKGLVFIFDKFKLIDKMLMSTHK